MSIFLIKMCERNQRRNVIGYWMTEKKRQKLNWTEFGSVCRRNGFDLVKLDLSRPLEEQGPFSIVLHKLTDIIALAEKGDLKAQEMIARVEEYFQAHPEVAVLDPLDNVRKLLDRGLYYSIINHSGLEKADVFTPTFVELVCDDYEENLKRLNNAGVSFPFVCKPSIAHGSRQAHKMSVIFNEKGLKDCAPPCVAQSFINHNAILYKIFIVGDQHYVVERPSLKNFYPCDQETIFFDSHEVSKADSTSDLSILDPADAGFEAAKPDPHRLQQIATSLRHALGMSLLGVDVVVEMTTGRYAIVDINAYPGYDGFPDFFDHLMSCIKSTIADHTASYSSHSSSSSSPNKQNLLEDFSKPERKNSIFMAITTAGDQDDSGFDTGDSSDEKKKKQQEQQAVRRTIISRK